MSPVSAGLDGLLALLLLAALALGVRLNARLKALRETQSGFAAAVIELNQAAARAEAGLSALKVASESAHDELLSRIETARGLASRLESASAEAGRVEARMSQAAGADRAPSSRAASAAGGALAAIAALAEGRDAPRAEREPRAFAAGHRDVPPPPPPRRPARSAFDEELFEAAPASARRREEPLDLGPLSPTASRRFTGDR